MKQQQTEDAEDRRKRSTKKRGTDRKAKRREEVLGKGGEKKPRAHMREQRAASSDDRSYRPTWPNPETLKFFGAWVFSYSYPLLIFLGCLIGALLLYNHLVLWALQGFSFGVFFFFLRLAGVRLLSHASNTSGDTTRLAQQFHLVFLQAHLMIEPRPGDHLLALHVKARGVSSSSFTSPSLQLPIHHSKEEDDLSSLRSFSFFLCELLVADRFSLLVIAHRRHRRSRRFHGKVLRHSARALEE